MATKLTKKQQTQLTEKLTGIIQKNNALQLRLSADRSVNEMNVNQISGALNRIHGQAIGKELPTEITIPVKQLGSGDPSPDNIRPIVGYEIDGIGTIYDGDLNIETGVLTVTKQMIAPSSTTRINTNSQGIKYWIYPVLTVASKNSTAATLSDFLSNIFRSGSSDVKGCFYVTGNGLTLVSVPLDNDQAINTVSEAEEWLSEYKPQFLIPLADPVTYTLTPQQMLQLLDQL